MGNSGCGALPPSYSGVYELKSSTPASNETSFFPVSFPRRVVVYHHPFKIEHPGTLRNVLSVGVNEPGLSGLFFTKALLGREQSTQDSLVHDVAVTETVPDYASDSLVEPSGQDVGPSCVYTYEAGVKFHFTPDSNALTDDLKGAYPSKVLSNPKDPTSA